MTKWTGIVFSIVMGLFYQSALFADGVPSAVNMLSSANPLKSLYADYCQEIIKLRGIAKDTFGYSVIAADLPKDMVKSVLALRKLNEQYEKHVLKMLAYRKIFTEVPNEQMDKKRRMIDEMKSLRETYMALLQQLHMSGYQIVSLAEAKIKSPEQRQMILLKIMVLSSDSVCHGHN